MDCRSCCDAPGDMPDCEENRFRFGRCPDCGDRVLPGIPLLLEASASTLAVIALSGQFSPWSFTDVLLLGFSGSACLALVCGPRLRYSSGACSTLDSLVKPSEDPGVLPVLSQCRAAPLPIDCILPVFECARSRVPLILPLDVPFGRECKLLLCLAFLYCSNLCSERPVSTFVPFV